MLRLQGGQVESLWEEVLPERLRELPEDLAQIDALVRDEALLAPIEAHWGAGGGDAWPLGGGAWPADVVMQTYVRLMVLKHRYGWGPGDADARGLRLAASAPLLPDPARRGGAGRVDGQEADPAARPETVAELSRLVIAKAQRETRFQARAVRIDSTVVEADVRYPTDLRPSVPSSPGAPHQARNGRSGGSPATESAPRAGSHT